MFNGSKVKEAVANLIAAGNNFYIASTGAGAGIADRIWQVPGASGILKGYAFPYAHGDFNLFVQKDWVATGNGYCSLEAAIALAQASYFRVQQICLGEKNFRPIFGIGLAAAAPTDRILKGGTRFFVAVRSIDGLYTCEISMEQEKTTREEFGYVCDMAILNFMLAVSKIDQVLIKSENVISDHLAQFDDGFMIYPNKYSCAVSLSENRLLNLSGEFSSLPNNFSDTVIFPGSYDPLHFGHDAMARMVEDTTGKKVVFEITSQNADKGALGKFELSKRLNQFIGKWPVIINNNAPLFIDKANQYNGLHGFMLGYDTAVRILDPKYYGGVDGLSQMLFRLRELNISLYVLSRQGDEKVFSLKDLDVPFKFKDLFIPVHGQWNVSSTILREGYKAMQPSA